MSILVRDAAEADIAGIARVHVQGWRESYAGFLSAEALAGLSVEERVEMWRGAFANPESKARCLVAEDADGEIVGFARGGPVRSGGTVPLATEAEIYAIYLVDKIKRQGVGRKLLTGVLDHLGRHGFRTAGLWVLKDNRNARRFYEALGGIAGPEQPIELRGETLMEVAYRFGLQA